MVWRTSDHVSILSLGPCNEHTFVVEVELPCAYALMCRFRCNGIGTEAHDRKQERAMYLPGWQECTGHSSQQPLVRLHIRKPASLFNDMPAQVASHRYSKLLTILGTICWDTFANAEWDSNWKFTPGWLVCDNGRIWLIWCTWLWSTSVFIHQPLKTWQWCCNCQWSVKSLSKDLLANKVEEMKHPLGPKSRLSHGFDRVGALHFHVESDFDMNIVLSDLSRACDIAH